MKKKIAVLLLGVATAALLLSGCQGSKGLETKKVKISQYKGVEVSEVSKPDEVTDDEVDEYIDSILQSESKTTELKAREIKEGDTVNIDFVGKMNGEAFEGGSGEDYPLTIGSGVFIDGFEDSVIGHKPGDKYDWEGTFPEDYGNADMAGKDVTFTITVNAITKDEVPELNAEFVKSVSKKSKTVKEYKQEVKENLEKEAQKTYEDTLESEAWEKVLENTEVLKYSEKEKKEAYDAWIEQYKASAEYYEMEYEEFIEEQMGMTVEEFEKQVETVVENSMKEKMVTDAIAEKEKIELDDKSYKAELKTIASDYGYEDTKTLKEAVDESDLKDEALKNVVKEWLADKSVQVAGDSE